MKSSFHFIVLLALCGAFLPARAQTPITNPVTIQLVPVQVSYYYKYGIYATAAGSTTPQLYELDTGGAGFYPVYGSTNSFGFGNDFVSSGNAFTNSYDSGNVYTGTTVSASVSLYNAIANGSGGYTNAPTASITTLNNILIGQTTSLTNTNGKPNIWPNPDPPVEGAFYGDFGLSLKYNPDGVLNLLAQLDYGSAVLPGFVVQLGYEGNPNASLQVGIATNYAAIAPAGTIFINMNQPDTTNTFPNGLPTYSPQLINGSLILSNTPLGSYQTNIGITLDTGATPSLHDLSGDTSYLTNYYAVTNTSGNTTYYLTNGAILTLEGTDTNNFIVQLYSATTEPKDQDGYVTVQFGTNYFINMGAALFYQYDILYDIDGGVIALMPLPEANQATLMAGGLAALFLFSFLHTARRRKRGRFRK